MELSLNLGGNLSEDSKMGRKSTVLHGRQFKYIKAGMYALNTMVGVLGLALCGVGIWIRVNFKTSRYHEVLDPVFQLCQEEDNEFDFGIKAHMDTVAYFLIFLGVAIIGTGFLGVCGTHRERSTCLCMFSILLYVMFAVLFTAGIQAMVKKDTFNECESRLSGRLNTAVNNYHTSDKYKQFMDDVQTHVGCCGAEKGPMDYDPSLPYPCNDTRQQEVDGRNVTFANPPCDDAIKSFFYAVGDNMIMILVVSFCIGIFTLLGMGMSAYLFVELRTVKRKR